MQCGEFKFFFVELVAKLDFFSNDHFFRFFSIFPFFFHFFPFFPFFFTFSSFFHFFSISPSIKTKSPLFLLLRFTDTHFKTFSSNIDFIPILHPVVNNRHYRPENRTHRVLFTADVLQIHPRSVNKLLFAKIDRIFFRIFQL